LGAALDVFCKEPPESDNPLFNCPNTLLLPHIGAGSEEVLDKACFILSGIDEKGLLQAVDTAVTMNELGDYGISVPDYVEENV